MSRYKNFTTSHQIITEHHAAQAAMSDMLENIKAKAEADGYDVEFFYDEVILTKKKKKESTHDNT